MDFGLYRGRYVSSIAEVVNPPVFGLFATVIAVTNKLSVCVLAIVLRLNKVTQESLATGKVSARQPWYIYTSAPNLALPSNINVIYRVGQKSKPDNFCNNFVYCRSQGLLKIFRAPIYTAHDAHRTVIFAVAQLSC